jgi:hypothetical protein
MAQLRDIFLSGLETILSVFEETVKTGIYGIDDENEFTSSSSETCSVRCVFNQFKEKDVSLLSFSDLIQPNDIIGLIPYEDMTLEMKSSGGYITFTDEGTYTIVGFEKDPMNVMYTVLMRKN